MTLNLKINGEARTFDAPLSIASLIAALGLEQRKLAVEVNRAIVPLSQHATHLLQENDEVELVQAIGGG
jgi:sulfur carrier protein